MARKETKITVPINELRGMISWLREMPSELAVGE
jgi:hypothetical protein